jgi:hypothetical protein
MSTDWAELDRRCREATGFDAQTIAESLRDTPGQDQGAQNGTGLRATDIWWFTFLMIVKLEDGRSISVPTTWFPEINHATEDQRRRWHFSGDGTDIHWPELNVHLSVLKLFDVAAKPAPR